MMSTEIPIGYSVPSLTHINNPIGKPTSISVTRSPYLSHTSHTCNGVSLEWRIEEKWRSEQTGCRIA